MVNYTLGETYRKVTINTSEEIVPTNPAFRAHPEDHHVFEERHEGVSNYQVTKALESGVITDLDKTVLSLVATFCTTACTTRNISELLTMMGTEFNKNTLESSLKRLHRYQLINFSRFKSDYSSPSGMRIITLTSYGSRVAKGLGVIHRFNPLSTATAEPYAIKSRCETTQLICNWLKNLPVEKFSVRPVMVVNADIGAIIRPAASINIWGETIYFETPRMHDGWLEDLVEKLHRYKLVFGKEETPTIIINGESEDMNILIHKALQNENLNAEIMYTDDLIMFGKNFKKCLYSFDESFNKLCFCIESNEREAM